MKNRLIKILSEVNPKITINNSSNLIETGLLDSFDLISTVSKLQDEFSIEIDGVDLIPENFESLDQIIKLIEKKNGK